MAAFDLELLGDREDYWVRADLVPEKRNPQPSSWGPEGGKGPSWAGPASGNTYWAWGCFVPVTCISVWGSRAATCPTLVKSPEPLEEGI